MSLGTSLAFSILKDLEQTNRNFCSDDYDYCLEYLSHLLDFKIYEYKEPFNSWQIPPRWDLVCGEIFFKEAKIYSVDHPLKVIGLSKAFCGKVSKEELIEHLHYDHRFPDAIPYHFRQFYRPWERDWGFCVPKTFYDSLQEGEYEVRLETREKEGSIKVAEYTIEGELSECFTFVAHLDHPGMANDDLAGVSVGVELFKKLSKKKTKFSYKLLLLPEIIGSEFYLGKTAQDKENYLGACFLEMLGSQSQLALQWSHSKNSVIENKLKEVLVEKEISFREGPFKSIICNDEAIWGSYQIPMCSLSRFPYPEYHSSLDNLSIIHQSCLDESVHLLLGTIDKLEQMTLVQKKFKGTPCTSHPSLRLYVDPGQRAFGTHQTQTVQKKRLLMDLLPLQKSAFFLEELVEATGLPQEEVKSYLNLWKEKGLLHF